MQQTQSTRANRKRKGGQRTDDNELKYIDNVGAEDLKARLQDFVYVDSNLLHGTQLYTSRQEGVQIHSTTGGI
jgi:hypothetical protein